MSNPYEREHEHEPEVLRSPFKRSAESEKLENFLAELPVGSVVVYEQIHQIIDEDPQRGPGYAIVMAVRTRLLREGAVWYAVASIGLKRADPLEAMQIVDGRFVRARRHNDRTRKFLGAVNYAELNNEQRQEFNWLASISGALKLFFSRGTQKKLKAQVVTEENQLDPEKILRIF